MIVFLARNWTKVGLKLLPSNCVSHLRHTSQLDQGGIEDNTFCIQGSLKDNILHKTAFN